MGKLGVEVAGLIAGVAVGFATGGTGFALVTAGLQGMAVGSMVGGLLFPASAPSTTTYGPQMKDVQVTTSTYGAAIPWGSGAARVGGNVIWAAPVREQINVTTTGGGGGGKGGGGGGGGTSTVTYTYFASFALGLSEGPVAAILRVWADSTLVYDITSGSDTIKKAGFNFRTYHGSEDQTPDSIIEADVGVGNAPAFRGLAYLVFDDIPIADYGNRLPQISVEVAFTQEDIVTSSTVAMASPSIFDTTASMSEMAYDWRNRFAYILYTGNGGGIGVIDLNSMTEIRQAPWPQITADKRALQSIYLGSDGGLYGNLDGATNQSPLVRVDAPTLKESSRLGTEASMGGLLSHLTALGSITLYSTVTGQLDFLLLGGLFGDSYVVSTPNMGLVYEASGGSGIFTRTGSVAQGQIGVGTGYGWQVVGGVAFTQDCRLLRFTVTALADEAGKDGISVALDTYAFTPQQLDPDNSDPPTDFADYPASLVYNASDDSVTFQVRLRGPSGTYYRLVKWVNNVGLSWTQPGKDLWSWQNGIVYSGSQPGGTVMAKLQGHDVLLLDPSTGGIILDSNANPVDVGTDRAQIYDGTNSSVFACVGPGQYEVVYVGRKRTLPLPLSDIVTMHCSRAGLLPTDIDVIQLKKDMVVGYVITETTQASQALLSLATSFMFNPAEIDGKIVFVKKGGAIVATIAQDALVRANATDDTQPEAYVETRLQEVELPQIISVSYLDPAMDYGTGTQLAMRNRGPDPTVVSQNQTSQRLSIVMSSQQAKDCAEAQLYEAWIARQRFQAMLPPTFLYLTPTDPVTLQFAGLSIRARVREATVGVDFSMDVSFLAESAGQFDASGAPAGEGSVIRQRIGVAPPSELILLDVPLLNDTDQMDGVMRGYWGVSPIREGMAGWTGAYLEVSLDSTPSAWIGEGTETAPSMWGYLETTPPDPVSCCRTDTDGSFIVVVSYGAVVVTSISDTEFLAGLNALALIKPNGEVEILQYQTAEHLDGQRYRLSGLLRGRRGTDTMASGHSVGERFVALSIYMTQRMAYPTSMRNTLHWWRATSIGAVPENSRITSWTPTGRDRMPYAPGHVAAAASGADIVLSWVRRTRVGGALVGGTGIVPLGETTEAYEVDILTMPGGPVKRTIKSAAPSVIYTADQIAEDFEPPPAELSLRVYQISEMVGRGFSRETTVEVTA